MLLPKRQTSMSQLPQTAAGHISSFSAKVKAIFLTRIGSGSRCVLAVDLAIEIGDRFAAKVPQLVTAISNGRAR
ncbi:MULTISPECIES: hypothetical protein [unclassified Bradyrhizobium]|uniref:hypothetical protein n=1 Tax=unclassified Bradyrhizobium TaxID=2631580 RepID=UPI001CD46FD1|nr:MULTISPECIES: hypothetical protein [unclassified Bradyrhizobium]MCA1379111.1 hypothetical protein [Bradyrhizobium sp. IC4060]MCA1489042.1 hypothetical protein [Bradyrhizobium sp. IC4061]